MFLQLPNTAGVQALAMASVARFVFSIIGKVGNYFCDQSRFPCSSELNRKLALVSSSPILIPLKSEIWLCSVLLFAHIKEGTFVKD